MTQYYYLDSNDVINVQGNDPSEFTLGLDLTRSWPVSPVEIECDKLVGWPEKSIIDVQGVMIQFSDNSYRPGILADIRDISRSDDTRVHTTNLQDPLFNFPLFNKLHRDVPGASAPYWASFETIGVKHLMRINAQGQIKVKLYDLDKAKLSNVLRTIFTIALTPCPRHKFWK